MNLPRKQAPPTAKGDNFNGDKRRERKRKMSPAQSGEMALLLHFFQGEEKKFGAKKSSSWLERRK